MKRFKKVYIEITNACNLQCTFCPKTKRKLEFMSLESFSTILAQIKDFTEYIYLHVKGEPLLHPQLYSFLDASYNAGLRVNITTNGTLISKTRDILLSKPALRQINFSLHSFDGNELNQSKENYMKDILSFTKEALAKTSLIITLRFWNLDKSNMALGSNYSSEKNFELLRSIEKEFGLPYRIEEQAVPGRGIKIADRLYVNHDYQFQWPDLEQPEDGGKGFCYGMRNQAAILVDGTVIPCCIDGEGVINLGNIHETSFTEIINSPRACNIVAGFSNRNAIEELCKKCDYRKRFGQ